MTAGIPLPHHAHVPGRNARHPEGAFDAIRGLAPPVTRSSEADHNRAWLAGLEFLEAGFYWEAHEVLEPVWMNAAPESPERSMVQAVIQLANAALKQVMDRPRASLRLCEITRGHLARAGNGPVMRLEPADILAAVAGLEAAIADGSPARIVLRRRSPG